MTMATRVPPPEHRPSEHPLLDYRAVEGFGDEGPPEGPDAPAGGERPPADWREWMMVGLGLVGLLALLSVLLAVYAVVGDDDTKTTTAARPAPTAAPTAAPAAASTLADAKGVSFEPFERVDPTLPPVPAGAVKHFKVDVFQHVTQVSKDLAPTEIWS